MLFEFAEIPKTMLAFLSPGPFEMAVIGVIAVLLFGSRLPSVARSMGKSLTEFKKGMAGVQDSVRDAVHSEPADSIDYDEQQEPSAPAFEPPQPEADSEVDSADTDSEVAKSK
ncbi:MAG: twin-arginine translocase TatA/TatE family subunit [Planctomycetota bacterium]